MCEIAVIDPEQFPIQTAHDLLARFHEEQGDGIGIVAVHNEGDRFEYDTYKSTTPHWHTIFAFLRRHYGDAWRFVLHGRAKTTGKVNRETAHPITIDCEKCDFDYIVHNGHVRQHERRRNELLNKQHDFGTMVDSEIIAHKISTVPESVEGFNKSTYRDLSGNLHFLLFAEDGILVRAGYKYHLAENFTMTCSRGELPDPDGLAMGKGKKNRWMLASPSDDEPELEFEESYTAGRTGNSRAGSSVRQRGVWGGYADVNQNEEPPAHQDPTVTIEYEDLCAFDHITVIKVAPGVLKLTDTDAGEENYIWRDRNPRLYFYYSPEPTPDNIDEIQEAVDNTKQQSLTDIIEKYSEDTDPVGEALYEEVSTTIAENVEEVTVRELAKIKPEVLDAAANGLDAAEAAHGE